jgi:NAD(P)-dependent dehydrogenase (short-subunit alcohol dehydrogenase family)
MDGKMRFENKVVFLTGGGGYLGGEAAYQFAKEGAALIIPAIVPLFP